MATKSKGTALKPETTSKTVIELLAYPIALLTLAAVCSPISQATLAPVFGAIPSAVNHQEAIVSTPTLAFIFRWLYKGRSAAPIAQYTAVWAFWIPVVQMYLFRISGRLGPVGGPALIGFLSCHTIIVPSVYAAAEALETLNPSGRSQNYAANVLASLLGVLYLVTVERWFQAALPRLTMLSNVFTPVKMQLLLASTYSYIAPSSLRLLAIPALIHAFFANPHFDSKMTLNKLNGTLQLHDWAILDRSWSNTGYISVLENMDAQYRVLRCDHSLLGGEWLLTEARRHSEGWKVEEPIYAVFEMLEAVRLVELDEPIPDSEAQALVVGLGVGTLPKAFISHGINITIVELDPVVHDYAKRYFGLPANHTAFIRDAEQWVAATSAQNSSKYDYIIHDVFTGGAEPLALFTETFLRNLRSLLTSNGVVALNYAGDLSIPLTIKVLNTIEYVFSSQCRIYRDTPSESEVAGDKAEVNEDFTNMVIFCRSSPGPIRFRKPIEADFLGSKSREHYMLPNPKSELQFPQQDLKDQASELAAQALKPGEEQRWSRQQAESAMRHWRIMRKVVPDAVWELW